MRDGVVRLRFLQEAETQVVFSLGKLRVEGRLFLELLDGLIELSVLEEGDAGS